MAPRLVTTPGTGANAATTRCYVWRPTVPLWDAELRFGNAGTWEGRPALLDTSFVNVSPEIRELRFRADAGFGYDPVFEKLEVHRSRSTL